MQRITRLIDNEQGVALILALMILLTLTGLVLAFLSASVFEPQISRNHSETIRARYVAEAGIEYAYDALASNVGSWNRFLVGATCAQGAILGAPDLPLPGLGAAHGTFTVRIRNDCKPGDDKLTGVAIDTSVGGCEAAAPGDATHDGNCKVIVTSTGTIATTTRTISVVVSKSAALPINGALAFPGSQADVNVSSLSIDGRDTKIADRPGAPTGGASAVYGIAVNGGLPALASRLEAVVASGARIDLVGKDRTDPSAMARGADTIRADSALTSQAVADFADAAKSTADVTINASLGNGSSLSNIGSTCATDIESSTCWGTAARPKIVYIRGAQPGAGARYTSLSLAGTSSGTGILIVENSIVEVGGNFRWNGPIVATGQNVGIRFRGDGVQAVYGAAIINELDPAAAANIDAGGTGKPDILYSNEALGLVQNALKRRFVTTHNWTDQ